MALAIHLDAQVEMALRLQPDGKTYVVYARSQVDYLLPDNNLVHEGQVTIVVPAGTLEPGNFAKSKRQLATDPSNRAAS